MSDDGKGTVPEATRLPQPGIAYLEWGAVAGGAFVATAISIVLLQFGAGVGLAVGAPTLVDGSASWNVLIAGLWTVFIALSASSAGGYFAGRMRSRWGDAVESEVEFRDGVHGLVTWATSTVAVVMIAFVAGSAVAIWPVETLIEPETAALTSKISTIFAFASAAGAALGAVAAWFGAVAGGSHRDDGLAIHQVMPRGLRRAPKA